MSVFLILTTLIILIGYAAYLLSKRKYDYWKKKNVPYLKPLPILGNYGKYILLQEYPGHVVQKMCQQFPNEPYFGAVYGTEPVLVVQKPELLKLIFTKEFNYFYGREITKYDDWECTTNSMFFASGDKWKFLRHNCSPMFTSAKMRNMFSLIEKCSHVFEDILDSESSLNIIEARHICARFTMDCISNCVFGVEANTMVNPVNNQFQYISEEIFRSTSYRGFKIIFRAIWPAIFYGLGFKCFPDTLQPFFSQLVKGVIQSRNYEPTSRNDFIDVILSLKKNEKESFTLDEEEMTGQCILFFAAGFETSATSMGFTLFELAKNLEAQKRAAEEVDDYLRRHDNKLGYDCVHELPYLDACLYETIRKYPVIGNLTREVMEDYVLPDGLKLDKGVRIHIPVYALHHNPEYFPEPELYKPERFLPENSRDIKPYTFLPYGEGPRLCIGKRFSKMQVIAGLVTFLKDYRVELANGMKEEVPFEARTFLIQPKETGLFLKITKREGWEQRKFART